MFENLRNAFREAIDNFQKELDRDHVPETVDKLLVGMRDEITDTKVRIEGLEDQIEKAKAEAAREEAEARTALRRGDMAKKIEDTETAEVATEFARKHLHRQEVLEQKVTALSEELELHRGEVEEMMEKFKEAKTKRDALAATAGRGGARESIKAADDLFAELDRMAEKIGDEERRGEAAEALDDFDLHVDPHESSPEPEVDVDARLRELKRRMGEE